MCIHLFFNFCLKIISGVPGSFSVLAVAVRPPQGRRYFNLLSRGANGSGVSRHDQITKLVRHT